MHTNRQVGVGYLCLPFQNQHGDTQGPNPGQLTLALRDRDPGPEGLHKAEAAISLMWQMKRQNCRLQEVQRTVSSYASQGRYKEAQRVSTKDSSLEERPTRPGWLGPRAAGLILCCYCLTSPGALVQPPVIMMQENQAGLGSVASQFDPVLPSDPPSPDSPMETFAAPAEVRHFTDGSFPAGFALQLFSHTQLRASNRRDLPKEGKGAQGDRLQPESPSPGERLSRGGGRSAGLGRPRPKGGAPGRGDRRSGPRAAGLRAGGFKYSSQPES